MQVTWATAECWLIDKWAGTEKEATAEFTRAPPKKLQKSEEIQYEKHRQWLQCTLLIAFNTRFHYSSLYVITLLSFATDWHTNNSTNISGPKTGCNTYFLHCFQLTTEPSAGRRAVPGVERTANALPLLDHIIGFRKLSGNNKADFAMEITACAQEPFVCETQLTVTSTNAVYANAGSNV